MMATLTGANELPHTPTAFSAQFESCIRAEILDEIRASGVADAVIAWVDKATLSHRIIALSGAFSAFLQFLIIND